MFSIPNIITHKYVSVNNITPYLIHNKNGVLSGDMFRPLLGHLQALTIHYLYSYKIKCCVID